MSDGESEIGQQSVVTRVFPQPFGRYVLLHPLAQGGMGAVFLAKYAGNAAAFERTCVIKTIRRALTEEPEAIPRFFDELKIVAQLNHRNICPVFDAGAVDGRCYFAMDHVAGVDLQALAERCRRNGAPLPPALSVHIVGEVLEALGYAHRLVDGVTGRPLGIVHRDVSPHNVLVSYEGEVKLIDFGLVVSRLKTNRTQPHVVVGKVQYMSPEHASGDPVDARADQYSVAVMATELFTASDFYADVQSQQAMWAKAAMGGHRPPGFAQLHPGLRAILDRALQAQPADRFSSCEELRDALDAWAVSVGLHATPRALRELVRKQFGSEADERRLLLASFADVSAQPAAPLPKQALPQAGQAPLAPFQMPPTSSPMNIAGPMVASGTSPGFAAPTTAATPPSLAITPAGPMPPAPTPAPRRDAAALVVDAAAVARMQDGKATHQRATVAPDIDAAMRALPKPSSGPTEVVARGPQKPALPDETVEFQRSPATAPPVAAPKKRGRAAAGVVVLVLLLAAAAAIAGQRMGYVAVPGLSALIGPK